MSMLDYEAHFVKKSNHSGTDNKRGLFFINRTVALATHISIYSSHGAQSDAKNNSHVSLL